MRWLYLTPVAILGIIGAVLALGLHNGDPTRVPSPLINKPAPDFSMARLSPPGQHFSRGDLLGHVSVVNVWASWCNVCRDEQPMLLGLADRGVARIYGVDYKDNRNAAEQWLQSAGNPYRLVGFDPNGNTGLNFGVYGVPETYVIDQKGIIRHKFVGMLTARDINNTLIPLVQRLKRDQ